MRLNAQTTLSTLTNRLHVIALSAIAATAFPLAAQDADTPDAEQDNSLVVKSQPAAFKTTYFVTDSVAGTAEHSTETPTLPEPGIPYSARDTLAIISGEPHSIYAKPVSWTYSDPWWHGMWINTSVLSGAFLGTLFVLELLPEDATAWNRADINNVPFYERWYNNIFKLGPHWDNDRFIFNYVLHPYAGAAYFMCARTCGFNFWQSMLYSAMISTFGWEFGIEACMERPSYQDLIITPVIGSIMGEGMYRLKRLIVDNNYELLGSPILGHIAAGFLDPVNEIIGALSPGTCRNIGPGCLSSQPLLIPSPAPGISSAFGFSISATF